MQTALSTKAGEWCPVEGKWGAGDALSTNFQLDSVRRTVLVAILVPRVTPLDPTKNDKITEFNCFDCISTNKFSQNLSFLTGPESDS